MFPRPDELCSHEEEEETSEEFTVLRQEQEKYIALGHRVKYIKVYVESEVLSLGMQIT